MKNMLISPVPQSMELFDGFCPCEKDLELPTAHMGIAKVLKELFPPLLWPGISLYETHEENPEGYCLEISENGVNIGFSSAPGLFYALVSLGQLIARSGNKVSCCKIKDRPALKVRGLMLDISRGKVPRLESLFALADKLALLKMNHFELYIEGFSFAYPSFPRVWKGQTPIYPEEIQKLDAYCSERFIELVPNQNSLGHMGQWLSLPEFSHLAERPEGSQMFGMNMPPSTLDAADKGSLDLISKMCGDLLPNFTSHHFNAGLDEPFELGQGKNKKAAEEGKAHLLYLDYTKKMQKMLFAREKRMLMWGDFVANHPELIEEIPKDIIILEWGYEAEHPFDERAKALAAAGLDFYLCPGTSSWSSYAGLSENMLANVRNAAAAAHRHGAAGLVVTDWGDGGHQQYLPLSYGGIVLSAALAWNEKGLSNARLEDALDNIIYYDKAGVMGRLSLELGRFTRFEEFIMPCRSIAWTVSLTGISSPEMWRRLLQAFTGSLSNFLPPSVFNIYAEHFKNSKPFDYNGLLDFLRLNEKLLEKEEMKCADREIVKKEFAATIEVLRYLGHAHAYLAFAETWSKEAKNTCLDKIVTMASPLLKAHNEAWLARNKSYGLEQSRQGYEKLASQAKELLT